MAPLDNTLILKVTDAEWVAMPARASSMSAPQERTLFLSPPNQRLLTRSEEAVSSLTEIMRRIEAARANRNGRLMILIGCTPFQMLRTVSFWCVSGKLTKEWAAMRNALTAICDGLRQSKQHIYLEAKDVEDATPQLTDFARQLRQQRARAAYAQEWRIRTQMQQQEEKEKMENLVKEEEEKEKENGPLVSLRRVVVPVIVGVFAFCVGWRCKGTT